MAELLHPRLPASTAPPGSQAPSRWLPPRWRNLLLTTHIAVAVGVLGTDLVLLDLSVTALVSGDPGPHPRQLPGDEAARRCRPCAAGPGGTVHRRPAGTRRLLNKAGIVQWSPRHRLETDTLRVVLAKLVLTIGTANAAVVATSSNGLQRTLSGSDDVAGHPKSTPLQMRKPMMHLLRRRLFSRMLRFIVAASAVLLTTGAGAAAAALVWWLRAEVNTVDEVNFERQLAIPPLAHSRVDAQGRRVFDLSLQQGTTEFRPGMATDTWGINGSHLGPTIRAGRGERVLLNVDNQLSEPTTIHWHGMHLPPRMDGGPHQIIHPGTTWSPTWEIDQPAATLWYHPHLHGRTATHVYRGLAGMFIVDDPQVERLHLPDRYGIDDVPVIVQDKKLGDDGRFDEDPALVSPTGLLGDTILVNGTVGPYLPVMTERVRLRLLNASNARIYNFGLSEDRPFTMIASDGGLLPQPHQTRRLLLSPGERAEILVTVRPGERTVLRGYPADLGSDVWNQRFAGGDDSLDILQLRATASLAPSSPVPTTLVDIPRRGAETVTRRDFRLGGTSINGRDMDLHRIDATVAAGTTEVWRLSSPGATPHNFHIHGVQFQVLEISGRPPPPPLGGWKDTVYVQPDSSMTLVIFFTDYTDPDAPYMFHCHLLSHEDRGMMGQFVVVERGEQAGTPPGQSHTRRIGSALATLTWPPITTFDFGTKLLTTLQGGPS